MGLGKDTMMKVVDALNNNPELQKMMKNWKKIAQYKLDDEVFYLEHKADGTVEFHDGEHEKPSFTIIASAELMRDIVEGKKDAQKSFFAKEYQIKGDVMATMKLVSLLKKMRK